MNAFILSCNMKHVHLRNIMLVDLKLYLMCGFIKSEGWPVVGFCPHVTSTRVFGINLDTLYPSFWSFKEVSSATNKAIRLYNFITLT